MDSLQELKKPVPQTIDTDFEVNVPDFKIGGESGKSGLWLQNIRYLLAGLFFGILLVKSEVVSWYRIQEMFRFQSFHMYGIIGSAIVTGAASIALIKLVKIKTFSGEPIHFAKKKFHKGTIYGGLLFGFGWAMTGACPGPLYALVGSGAFIFIVPLLSAIAGTWVYGIMRERLPH